MSNDLIEFVDFIFDRYAFLELEPTATRGERTRVETTVAIEFAASWKPLM